MPPPITLLAPAMSPLRCSAVVMLVTLAVTGCAGQPGVRDWMSIHEESFTGIVPGTSTRKDVEALLGKPLRAWVFPRLTEEVWDYRYAERTETKNLWVYFGADGTVKRYEMILPRLYQTGPSSRRR